MSTRSLVELNHDYVWSEYELNYYRRNGMPGHAPGYMRVVAIRHHSEPCLFDQLHEALKHLLEHYVELARSGDCGNWDPETEEPVKKARAALELWRYAQRT